MGITEKELFKQMEAGTVMAAEVLPKLAKEFRKAAMGNGAFDAASKKTRAELNRFMTQLSLFKNSIFEGGFGEGLSGFFKMTSTLLKDIRPLATFIGKVLKWAFIGLSQALNIVSAPLRLVSNLFSVLNDTAQEGVGIGGALLIAAGSWLMLSQALRTTSLAMLAVVRNSKLLAAVPWIATALAAEDFGATVLTGGKADTAVKRVLDNSMGEGYTARAMNDPYNPAVLTARLLSGMWDSAFGSSNASTKNKVEVKIDATGLNDKQIDYRVNQQMGNAITDIAGESGN